MVPPSSPAGRIEAAFRAACAAELAALKPGNVHVHAPGHGMRVDDFLRSAAAAAGPLCHEGASLGARVFEAVAATRGAVGQNTNLGILLLAAPLAMAAERGGALPAAVGAVLAGAGVADADRVFRAIVLAAPGGLGDAPAHDVRAPATVGLVAAMAASADRDSIARQYATGFADVFAAGAPAYAAALARGRTVPWAASAVYLGFLAAHPDSHVRRRRGAAAATRLMDAAMSWRDRLEEAADPAALMPGLLAWDAKLKRQGCNPGTSADLTVASVFAHDLMHGLQAAGHGG